MVMFLILIKKIFNLIWVEYINKININKKITKNSYYWYFKKNFMHIYINILF